MAKEMTRKDVLCPKCNLVMLFVRGPYGIFLSCPNYHECGYTHMVNQKTLQPLGTPADAATRALRVKTHEALDPIWKSGDCTRTEAYWWLSLVLNLPEEKCHIGMFDKETCTRAIEACKSFNKSALEKKDAKQSVGGRGQLVGQPHGG